VRVRAHGSKHRGLKCVMKPGCPSPSPTWGPRHDPAYSPPLAKSVLHIAPSRRSSLGCMTPALGVPKLAQPPGAADDFDVQERFLCVSIPETAGTTVGGHGPSPATCVPRPIWPPRARRGAALRLGEPPMYLDWRYVLFWIGGLIFVGGALVYGMRKRSQHDQKIIKPAPPVPPTAAPRSTTRRDIR
jgi:hypothetical protein